jgi:hypothetical protein
MTAEGGHGGSTPEEVDAVALFVRIHHRPTPFLDGMWLGQRLKNRSSAVGTPREPLRAEQVDVASTVALLMGLPIPQDNVGTVLPELLEALSPAAKLAALQVREAEPTLALLR